MILKQVIQSSIDDAMIGKSKLTKEVLSIDGMSSSKVRHFLNNLINGHDDVRYLEVGIWKGSTFISALFNNDYEYAVGIDNFSEFGSPKNECFNNLGEFGLMPKDDTFVVCDDFNKVKLDKMFNIYFYDGNHERESQKKAFTLVNDNLDDVFIAIIDDWNHQRVQDGTNDAFTTLDYTVLKEWILPADIVGDKVNWWNGLYVAIIKK